LLDLSQVAKCCNNACVPVRTIGVNVGAGDIPATVFAAADAAFEAAIGVVETVIFRNLLVESDITYRNTDFGPAILRLLALQE
jgi:hypothetical protein